ncbi:thioredoxin [Falsarthrobacter nasiphocae]|uniref:Thioredoxin n=1 Tax=Falsarthrobacter nasiphocae TaxID=189863 RepID=A0AAE3YDY2_9MICC|nr:thioredoxin [Falsarthrobacter nasiphocae]MDR6892083.1 thioredoxin 1 [Falsarthrobacter nasiphocae]
MSAARDVTDATFASEVLESETPVIVDFWAEWCGPCRQVGPILDKIAEENEGKVNVVKVNVDDNPATAAKYGITSIPMMMAFKDGEIVAKSLGAKPKPALEADFAAVLGG